MTNRRVPLPPRRVVLPFARQACEHVCFAGAAVDFIGYLVHWEFFLVIFVGKLAFVCGAAGIYALHAEEAMHRVN